MRLSRQESWSGAADASDSPGSSLGLGSVGAGTPMAAASQESAESEASQGGWEPGSQSSDGDWASSQGSGRRRPDKPRVLTWRRRRLRRLAAEFKAAGSDVASSQEARGSDEKAEEGMES